MSAGTMCSTAMDWSKYRQQYLNNLQLQSNINDFNLQVNKMFQRTGQNPTPVMNSRTPTEKSLDIERLKMNLKGAMLVITRGNDNVASDILNKLPRADLEFLAQHMLSLQHEIAKQRGNVRTKCDTF